MADNHLKTAMNLSQISLALHVSGRIGDQGFCTWIIGNPGHPAETKIQVGVDFIRVGMKFFFGSRMVVRGTWMGFIGCSYEANRLTGADFREGASGDLGAV